MSKAVSLLINGNHSTQRGLPHQITNKISLPWTRAERLASKMVGSEGYWLKASALATPPMVAKVTSRHGSWLSPRVKEEKKLACFLSLILERHTLEICHVLSSRIISRSNPISERVKWSGTSWMRACPKLVEITENEYPQWKQTSIV